MTPKLKLYPEAQPMNSNSYESVAAQRHEVKLQAQRRELKTEVQNLAGLKKKLQKKIGALPKGTQGIRAA